MKIVSVGQEPAVFFPFNDFIVIPWTSSSFSGVNALLFSPFLVCARVLSEIYVIEDPVAGTFYPDMGLSGRPSSTLLNGGGAKFNKQKNNYVVFVRNDALG